MFFTRKLGSKVEYINNVKVIRTINRRKTVLLRVKNKQVEILCPYFVSESYLIKLLKKKNDWIKKKLQDSLQKKIDYLEHGYILFKGKKIEINELKNNEIILNGKKLNTLPGKNKNKKSLITHWLRGQSESYLSKRTNYISKKISIKYNSLKIKSYISRWGCCNNKGEIFLNWKLIMCPENVIDYVIIHELVHVRVPNHSKLFWNLVKEKDPNFIKKKNWLKENGSNLINF